MIFVSQYPCCQFLLLLQWPCGAVHGVGGGDCSIAAENIIYLCNAGVGQCSLPKSKPNQLILSTATQVSHLDPTRKKQRVSTSGTDSPIISEERVCYTWTRYSWQISIFNHQKASVKHLDPTCRGIDTQTPNWKITEPIQKKIKFRCYWTNQKIKNTPLWSSVDPLSYFSEDSQFPPWLDVWRTVNILIVTCCCCKPMRAEEIFRQVVCFRRPAANGRCV